MRVLVDVDGILCDFDKRFRECITDATGKVYSADDITSWDYTESLGLSARDLRVARLYLQASMPRAFSEYPGAVAAVRGLMERHSVAFVTSPCWGIEGWVERRQDWLRARFERTPIIHTDAKEWVTGDVIIDDKPENVERWLNAHPDGRGILWAQPWNASAPIPSRAVRTNDWGRVAYLLEVVR